MNIPLKVLILEDSDSDAALNVRALETAGYKVSHEVVNNGPAMKAALKKQSWDVIISDHNLPQFDSLKALAISEESGHDIPFIVVSGVIGEENAVALMKAGAQDYVMKGNLSRLAPAVERELQAARIRREHKQGEEALRDAEKLYQNLFDNMLNGFTYCQMLFDGDQPKDCIYLGVNTSFGRLTGLKDVVGKKISEVIPGILESDAELIKIYGRVALTGVPETFELYFNALKVWISGSVYCPEKGYFAVVFEVITNRKEIEARQELSQNILKVLNRRNDKVNLIKQLLILLKEFSGCEAVGIRLKRKEDYPYYEYNGFLPGHVEKENHLCSYDAAGELIRDSMGNPLLECMCGNVIQHRFDPNKPFFTGGGSFWTNCTTELLASTTEKDRQGRTRNRCNGEGYESVALIPLKVQADVIGLLQLNDTRRNVFTPKLMEFYENISHSIAIAIGQVNTQELLLQSEERAKAIVLYAPVGIATSGIDRKFISANFEFCNMLGFTENELRKLTFEDITYGEDLARSLREVENLDANKKSFFKLSIRCIKKDGTTMFGEVSVSAVRDAKGNLELYIVELKDITGQYILEQELKLKAMLLDNSSDIIFFHEPIPNGKLVYVNKITSELLGYTREELMTMEISQISLDPAKGKIERNNTGMSNGVVIFEDKFRCKDGSYIPVEVSANRIELNGKVFLLTSCRNITERKTAEGRFRQNEEQFRAIASSTPDHIVIQDLNLRYTFVINPQLGLRETDMIGKTDQDILKRDEAEKLTSIKKKVLQTGKSYHYETALLNSRGTPEFFEGTFIPRFDNFGKVEGLIGYFRNVTEHKKLGEERQKLARLESVGLLAGGIAHDFNNILMTILGNISNAKGCVGDKKSLHECLSEAERASFRARDLTQQLLTFAKGGVPIKKLGSIVEVLKESSNFALRGSSVKCQFSIPGDLWNIEADEGQISQVINNIVLNAQQAMPAGGTLKISVVNITLSEKQSLGKALPLDEGDYIRISIRDSGVGIQEELLPRIFDPYFTTKQKGSGLGLATSYSIIKNHQGMITAESRVGIGTTLHIYLPASREKVIQKEEIKEETPAVVKGKILFMDDEEGIRGVIGRMLKNMGCEVELSRDGDEAIKLYQDARTAGKPFDAVIMDLTIPGGMGGSEAIRKLLEIDPAVKAIVSSGYANDPVISDYKKYGFSGIIVKPYTKEQLRESLNSFIR